MPIVMSPSLNVTVPVIVPAVREMTFAVNVTLWPTVDGFAEDINVVPVDPRTAIDAFPVIEDVTPAVLRTAVRRTLDGVNALIELTVERRIPVKRAGITCRWCPLNQTCAEGLAYLERGDRDVDP